METTKLEKTIINLIPKGEDNRITSTEIKKLIGLNGATIRKCINQMRANFIPIASDSRGYFFAENQQELDHTIAQINSRIHNMIKAREGLKKAQKLMEEKN